jgi:hypothetical protein
MNAIPLLFLSAALVGCASGQQSTGGYATYDDLRRATEACQARGGRLELIRNGDAQAMSDYECKVSAQ